MQRQKKLNCCILLFQFNLYGVLRKKNIISLQLNWLVDSMLPFSLKLIFLTIQTSAWGPALAQLLFYPKQTPSNLFSFPLPVKKTHKDLSWVGSELLLIASSVSCHLSTTIKYEIKCSKNVCFLSES